MATDLLRPRAGRRMRLGHPSRLSDGAIEVSLLLLGHVVVFFLTLFHDEFVVEMVAGHWLPERMAERSEIVIGLVLFLCWSALLLRLMTVLRQVRDRGPAA